MNARRRGERAVGTTARLGLAGRSGFYLILAAITCRLAFFGPVTRQDNAQGALTLVGRNPLGKVAIAATAVGFLLLGVSRLLAALRSREQSAPDRWKAAFGGIFYLALTAVPASFLAGRTSAGSEQGQQHSTARLLGLPGGGIIVVLAGIVFVVVCAIQVRSALREDFTDALRLGGVSHATRTLVVGTGKAGIALRAIVFAPIGVFLIAAGVTFDPAHSRGLDGELLGLARNPWGKALLAFIALAFATFALYSAFEARYRDMSAA